MSDLFPEIEKRLGIAIRYDRWKSRLPWRLVPVKIRQRLFGFMKHRS